MPALKTLMLPVLVATTLLAQASPGQDVVTRVSRLGALELQYLGRDPFQRETFELRIQQPVDHAQPQGPFFTQKAILTHRGFDRPTVLITEGYTLGKNYTGELARMLDANEVRVEYRFFGQSHPDAVLWDKLNLAQSTRDYHALVTRLKKLYTGPWACVGWSKGGETALAYRRHFPEDVKATVAYDAPINFAQEDPRIDAFFSTVGTPEVRAQLIAFQRTALKARDQVLPLLSKYSYDTGWYCPLGLESAFEFAVLEYPFSFWQYTDADPKTIPAPDAKPEAIFKALQNVSGFSAYGRNSFNNNAMWEFFNELGYYGYVTEPVKDLLKTWPRTLANATFAGNRAGIRWKPEVMKDIDAWLKEKGHGILYIYAQNDPWAATRISHTGRADALVKVLPKGNHFTFIETFPPAEQKEMLGRIKAWMGLK